MRDGSAFRFKVCPVCRSRVFADMMVCYGCMHSFPADEQTESESTASMDATNGDGRGEAMDASCGVDLGEAADEIGVLDEVEALDAAEASDVVAFEGSIDRVDQADIADVSQRHRLEAHGPGGWRLRIEMSDGRQEPRMWTFHLTEEDAAPMIERKGRHPEDRQEEMIR